MKLHAMYMRRLGAVRVAIVGLALAASGVGAPIGAQQKDAAKPLARIHLRQRRTRIRAGSAIRRPAQGRQPEGVAREARGPAASCRVAVRQGERRIHGRPVQVVGLRDRDRTVRRPLPDADRPRAGTRRAAEGRGEDRRADPQGRQHFRSDRRAAAGLQRLFGGWRRHRGTRLRELRRAARLRRARRTRHRRQRQDRDRALRRLVARHQAEGRGRTRRDRMPDLLRPARRRLRAG